MTRRHVFLCAGLVWSLLAACERTQPAAQTPPPAQAEPAAPASTTTNEPGAPVTGPEAARPVPEDSADDAKAAAQVVRDYYRAIDAKDFDRAYALWGPSGPPGQSRAQFAGGFAQTESVTVTTSQPSRVEGAAGSRYVTVPVTIDAKTTSGARQRFEGSYVLRRSVVDGATEAQRTWHLERASLREVAPTSVR